MDQTVTPVDGGAANTPFSVGHIEAQLRRDITALGKLAGKQRTYAEIAYRLANALDGDTDEGGVTALASLARELRAALDEIWKGVKVDRPGDEIVKSLSDAVG